MVNIDMSIRKIRTCFVTGATGFIGSHLVEFLLGRDVEVRCLLRDPDRPGWLEGLPIRIVKGDLFSPGSLADGAAGVDAVFHLAGATAALNRREYFSINAEGCLTLGRAVRQNGDVKVFVYVSSAAAGGPSLPGTAVREDDEPAPVTYYGRSKLEGERLLQGLDDLPLVVVRPPAVYGPRDKENLQLFKMAAKGILPVFNARAWMSLIHVRDLVRGIWAAAERGRGGSIFNLADDNPVRAVNLPEIMGQALGRKVRGITVPTGVLRSMAFFYEVGGKLTGKMPVFNLQKVNELTAPGWVLNTDRAAAELAFKTEICVEAGFLEVAEWYRDKGWI